MFVVQHLENLQGVGQIAYFIQPRQGAQHDVVFLRFFQWRIYCGQGVVGVGNPRGRKAVAYQLFLLVFAVGDDINAQLVKQLGNFGVGFGIKAARVVKHPSIRCSHFGRNSASRYDACHLAMNDIGFFLFEHFDVGQHALQITDFTVLVEINIVPFHAMCHRIGHQWAV